MKKKYDKVALAKVFNTRVSSEQLLAMINDDFGLPVTGKDKISLVRELDDFLLEQCAAGRQPILIIGEAQNLSAELLEEVRMLSNVDSSHGKLLQIMLVVQPELRKTMASQELLQLRQRISINCHLKALSREATVQYILHRLEDARQTQVATEPERTKVVPLPTTGTGGGFVRRLFGNGVRRKMIYKNAQGKAAVLAGLAILAAVGSGRLAQASDLELRPSLSVSEEYDDNILQTVSNRKTEFTTRLQPGAALHYRTPSLVLDSSYVFDYRYYARGSHSDEQVHNLDLKGSAELIDNFLYVEVGDTLHRVTVDVGRDVATESLLAQQTTQNIATISSSLLWHPTQKATLRTGYRFTDTRYWQGDGIDNREHRGFADFEHQLTVKVSLTAGYAFTRRDTTVGGYDRNELSGGFRYAFTDTSFLYGSIGNSWQSFTNGATTSDPFWHAGLSHAFGRTVVLLDTTVQNAVDPLSVSTRQVSYSGRLDRAFSRGTVGLGSSYTQFYITETGRLDQRRLNVTASGRYEITQRLASTASVILDRYSQRTAADYPYRLAATGGLSYSFYNNDTAVTLAYTYLTDRFEIDSPTGARVTNRALLGIRTVF